MDFKTEMRENIRVIHIKGHWTGGHDDDPLRAQFKSWVADGERKFVMDFTGVDLLNSVGLGSLVGYYTTLAREGGRVALASMSERHRRAAYVARILDLFDEFESVDDAIAKMASS